MKAINVVRVIEAGLDGEPYTSFPDGGFITGRPENDIRALAVMWMATAPALRKAVELGCDMVVCHELPFIGVGNFSEGKWQVGDPDPRPETIPPDEERRRILEDNRITLFMCHYGLDELIVYDAFAEALGLGEPIRGTGWTKVYDVGETTVEALAQRAKRVFNLPFVRVAGDPRKTVHCAGSLWGGLGLNNNAKNLLRREIDHGADVCFAGEMDEFAAYQAEAWGVPIIECGHAVSEMPGLRRFAEMVRDALPELRVEFVPNRAPISLL